MYSYLYKKYIEWGNYYRNVDNQYGSTLYPVSQSQTATDCEAIDGSKSLAYLVEPSLLTKAKRTSLGEIEEKRVFITQSKMVETDQPSLSTCSSMTPQRNESCTSSSSSS